MSESNYMNKENIFMFFRNILMGLIIIISSIIIIFGMIIFIFGKSSNNSEFNPKVKITLMSTDGKILRTDIVNDSDIQTTEFSKIIVYKVNGNLITFNGIFLREKIKNQ